jgi:hypothetical protein
MVNATKCRYRVNKTRYEGIVIGIIRVICEIRFLTQDHIFCVLRGGREHAPVDIGAVPQIWVV